MGKVSAYTHDYMLDPPDYWEEESDDEFEDYVVDDDDPYFYDRYDYEESYI